MTTTNFNTIAQKILNIISRKGGMATLQDIRRSLSEFNQDGGAERLRDVLKKMLSHEMLSVHYEKATNGREVEFYRQNNGNRSNNSSNGSNSTCSVSLIGNDSNDMRITGSFNLVIEGGRELVNELAQSLIALIDTANGNSGTDNGNSRNALPVAKSKESAPPKPQKVSRIPTPPVAKTKESTLPAYNETPFDLEPAKPSPTDDDSFLVEINNNPSVFESDPDIISPWELLQSVINSPLPDERSTVPAIESNAVRFSGNNKRPL